jgi:2-oxoglutarate ferredoxin oxidoreductase subunit delta
VLSKKTKVKYQSRKKKDKYPRISIQVYEGWCKRCNICVALCGNNVLINDERGYPRAVKPIECNRCNACILRCPDFAITLVEGRGKEKTPGP